MWEGGLEIKDGICVSLHLLEKDVKRRAANLFQGEADRPAIL